jgi:hypothetical protein
MIDEDYFQRLNIDGASPEEQEKKFLSRVQELKSQGHLVIMFGASDSLVRLTTDKQNKLSKVNQIKIDLYNAAEKLEELKAQQK